MIRKIRWKLKHYVCSLLLEFIGCNPKKIKKGPFTGELFFEFSLLTDNNIFISWHCIINILSHLHTVFAVYVWVIICESLRVFLRMRVLFYCLCVSEWDCVRVCLSLCVFLWACVWLCVYVCLCMYVSESADTNVRVSCAKVSHRKVFNQSEASFLKTDQSALRKVSE